ncbi:RNA polymerase sigma-70 factor [Flavivirga aquimarina]|uniref:RNA polymerase sigma-70 factor n=1 Tax=Flavivirga aquimarina TaxID=2027862 RepID=A0ABT8WAT8_9FLAO|nr:RNA polymerase sigma-70 factor [Flavivirga aquimarina]MDO5970262.1 RNA polymerase sigma-70 factor [Flavivirga aquimarina]
MNELEVIKRFRAGEESAFRYLFNLYYDRLVAYIAMYTHDKMSSEDIVQQAFIDLWNDRNKLDELKSPKNYLYAIAYNRFIDSVNKNKRQNKLLDQVYERALRDRINGDTEQLEKRIEKMNHIIESLPPKCKEIIIMNKMQGFKYKEIAEIMNISIKTVEAQMGIAYKKIRKGFEKDKLTLFFLRLVKPVKNLDQPQ